MEQELYERLAGIAKRDYRTEWQDVAQQAWLDLAEGGKLDAHHTNSYLRMVCRDAWARTVGNGRTAAGLCHVDDSLEILTEKGVQFSANGGRTNPQQEVELAEKKEALASAIAALRPDMRALVLTQLDTSEPTLEMLGERLGVDASTVMRRLDEAYRVIRLFIADHAPETVDLTKAEMTADLPLFAQVN